MQTFWLVGHVGEAHFLPNSTAPDQNGIVAESGDFQIPTEQLEPTISESKIYGKDNSSTGLYMGYAASVPI